MIDINGWQEIKLRQMGKFSTSSVDKKSIEGQKQVSLVNYMDVYSGNTIDSNIKLMKVSASVVERARSQVFRGDILFTPSSETPEDIGYSAVVGEELTDTLHSYHTVRLRPKSNTILDIRFSAWFANAEGVRKQFSQKCAGSTRYILSIPSFESVKCKIPISLTAQRKIANCLDTVQAAIEKTEALIHKYQQIKVGLMHDLFTRGVTADGKLRPPREQALELYKETPVGLIPKEWVLMKLQELSIDIGDGIHATPTYTDNSAYRFINGNNLKDGEIVFDGRTNYVDQFEYLKHRQNIGNYTILLSINGTIGNLAIYKGENVVLGKSAAYISLKDLWHQSYTYYWLQTPIVKKHFEIELTGTTIKNLSLAAIRSTPVLLPEQQEGQQIIERLTKIDHSIGLIKNDLHKLKNIKFGLMHDLLTGKVQVKIDQKETAHV